MFRYRDTLPGEQRAELNRNRRPPLPELVLETSLSVGIYLDLLTDAGHHADAAAVTTAIQTGVRAAVDTVQSWVGDKMRPPVRLDIDCTYCRHSGGRTDLSRPHLHLQVSTTATDQHGREHTVTRDLLRMSGPVAQVQFAQRTAAEIEAVTDARFVPAQTATRWEIAGLTDLAERTERWGCRATSALTQWYPLDKLDGIRTA